MSTDYPSFPDPGARVPLGRPAEEVFTWQPAPPPRKFQHRYRLHVVLFLLTFATTTLVGALGYQGFHATVGVVQPLHLYSPSFLAGGLWYSIPVLVILGAHEFGHYAFCRFHNVDATLPYFLPAPPLVVITGTFGAVIRIREAFPSKRALFDIGVAGPIAGFLALLPFLYWGITLSRLTPVNHDLNALYFGEPLLYKAFAWLHFGHVPDGYDVFIHPMCLAAWFGMLATALNLLPFGQLDGGHIIYSVVGRRAAVVSLLTLGAALVLTFQSVSWVSITVMMLVMAFLLGLHHPRVIDEATPLDGRRQLVALLAFVIFALCFTPVPIQMVFGK